MRLRLEDNAGHSIRQRIVQAIEEKIARGELGFGDRLPSSEELSRENGIHRLTVLAAYRELARKGRVQSHPRRGTVVCQTSEYVRGEMLRSFMASLLERGKALGFTLQEMEAEMASAAGRTAFQPDVARGLALDAEWDLYAPPSVH